MTPTDYDMPLPDVGALPAPPAWATYLPDSTLQDLQNQRNAEEFGHIANGQLADLWGQQAQQSIDAIAAQYSQGPQWGPPSPVQVEHPPMQVPTPEDQPPTATADQMPDRAPVTMNVLADLFGKVLDRGGQAAQGVAGAVQDRAGQVGDYLANNDPQSIARQAVGGLTDAAVAQTFSGDQARADAKRTLQDTLSPVGEGMLAQGKSNVENLQSGNPDERTAATMGLVNYGGVTGGEGKVIGKAAEAIAPEVMAKIDPALQHAVQVAVDQGIIDAKNLDKVAAGLNDPKFVARLEKTQNPTRDLKAPWQQDAYTVYTANKKMADETAAWDAIGKGAPEAANGPADGMVRVYRGQHSAYDPAQVSDRADRGRWFVTDPEKANLYGGNVSYVDIPRDVHTQLLADEAEFARTDPGIPHIAGSVMLPSDLAKTAQPLGITGEAAAPTPESVTAQRLPPEGPPTLEDRAPYTGAGESQLAQNPAVRGLNTVQSALKQVVVQGMMHPLMENAQLGRTYAAELNPAGGAQAAYRANRAFVDSKFAQDWMTSHTDAIARGEAAGATGLRIGSEANPDVQTAGKTLTRYLLSSGGSAVGGFTSAKAAGESNEDALKRAAIFGVGGAAMAKAAPIINSALWGRMVPVMKTEAFDMLSKTYGDEVAAKRVNDIFGGQNLAKLGRNPEVQQVIRSTFLAPDWLESWARNLGAVVKPGAEGDAARKWWAATGISSFLGLEGMNMALNGHTTFDNEPGHQGELETTGILRMMGQKPERRTYMDINMLGPAGSVINNATKSVSKNPLDVAGSIAGRFASNHLNIAPSAGLSAVENYSGGKQIVPEGTPPGAAAIPEAAAAASKVVPIPLSGLTDEKIPPGMAAVSAVTGMRSSEGKAASPATYAALKAVGVQVPPIPTNLTAGTGGQVTIDAKQKRDYDTARGSFLDDWLSKNGGKFQGPDQAKAVMTAADKVAAAHVLEGVDTTKIESKAQVQTQNAENRAGVAPGTFWKGGATTPSTLSAPPATVPAASTPASGKPPANATFWKKAA